MIEISPERKSPIHWKSLVRVGVVCMIAAGAAAAAASQMPSLAHALTFGRFAAVGGTVGLGVSIASLLAGAILIRGPVAANAVKFGSMALMIVSLGILVGACNQSSSVSLISGTLGSYASGSMNTTEVSVIPAATTITTTQSLSVTVSVITLTTTGTFAAPGSVVLSSADGNYTSAALTLCGADTTGCAAGSVTTVIPPGLLTPGTENLTAQFTPATGDAKTYPAASGSALVAVTLPALITPTVTVAPSASITTVQALMVAVTVSGGGSNPTPTGSVMLTSGTYSSQSFVLTNGTATIDVPAGSLATGTDTLNVFYTADKNSTGIYNSSSGSGTVTVTLPPPTTPAITVTPSASMITTAQALSVTVTVTGTGATPTGMVQLTGGGFTSANIALTAGSATINIPAGMLNEGVDMLTVTYTPDTNSSPIYASVAGTCVVTVNPPPASAPAITATPTPSMATTAQAVSVLVTVTGTGATPTGKVQLTGGGYTSAGIALNGGSATINIPAGSLNVGADTLSVTYTPDAASSATYSSNTATALVTVTSAVTTAALDNPNGLAIDSNNRLYVANSGGNQVLVYTETLNGSNVVTGLTQTATITTNISSPTRLAFDAAGNLYVTNLGNNTVSVYDTSFNPIPAGTISTGIMRPLGIAVDQTGDVYVGNNSADNITVYSGSPAAGFTLTATLTDDNSGNQFLAPGDITFAKVAGVNELFVGLGPGGGTDSVIIYPAPLRQGSDPATELTDLNCPSGPNGPTGVATNAAGTTIYISSFYNSSVAEYTFTGIQTGNECPAPISTSGVNSQIAKPEGIAIDSSGNVFVSNSSADTVTVYNPIDSAPVYTQH